MSRRISSPALTVGVVAFTTEIAEPDKDGGALRYRGVDIENLVSRRVTFGDAWALLVDGAFGRSLPPAEPFPLPIHSRDVRVDVQAGLAMLAPIWGYAPLLDTDDATARAQLARAVAVQWFDGGACGDEKTSCTRAVPPRPAGRHKLHLWEAS
jgi:citrate synthase